MRTVRLTCLVPARTPDDVYATLSDLRRYPELCDAVRSVTITTPDTSTWEVAFRAGTLRWVERDDFDPATCTLGFTQLEGDVAVFDGAWRCTAADGGTQVRFEARLDMGIPSLADALEPIAARTLVENTTSVVVGLFGPATVLTSSDVAVPTLAGSAS